MVVIRFCSDVAEHFELEAATALDILSPFQINLNVMIVEIIILWASQNLAMENIEIWQYCQYINTKVLSPNYYALQSTKTN